ncbi:MAG: ABC-type uncharacterized transport system permease subunit [Alteromonadaceae bacterium]|jgi:ABC-type uncharacterized transport system permease subunit
MYLTSQHIPELAGLNLQQRMLVIKQAVALLGVPHKVLLNVLKLVILAHFFSVLARFEGWLLLPYLLVAGLVYPLITNPVTYLMVRPLLAKARQMVEF